MMAVIRAVAALLQSPHRWVCGVLDWVLGRLRAGWERARDCAAVLVPTRASAIAVVAGIVLLLFSDQGGEALASLADSSRWYQIVFFFVALPVWAASTWYWARIMLYAEYGVPSRAVVGPEARASKVEFPTKTAAHIPAQDVDRTERFEAMKEWTPRVLGCAVFVITALAFCLRWRAGRETDWLLIYAGICLALCALFLGFVVFRHDLARRRFSTDRLNKWLQGSTDAFSTLADLPLVARWAIRLAFAAAAVLLIWACFDPASMGWYLGSAAVLFFAFAMLVTVGSYLIFLTREAGFPVATSLIVWVLILSLWVDNHALRRVSPEALAEPTNRPSIDNAAEQWFRHVQSLHPATPDAAPTVPLVIVATAGGASRAGYWTGEVLAALREAVPQFSDHVFAVSSVSGGSVGAATFVAMTGPHGPLVHPDTGEAMTEREATLSFLSQDFLSPLLVGMLYPDLVQKLLPHGFLPDRAESLEKGWERAWEAALIRSPELSGVFAAPFLSLWSSEATAAFWRPAMFLNGTHEETGKRLITSNIQIDRTYFVDALDLYNYVGGDIRLSTAVLNTARFPYFSPAGTLRNTDSHAHGHIVDGGYFENFGARTASEILVAVQTAYARQPRPFKLAPIIIQISSDPDLAGSDGTICTAVRRGDSSGREPVRPEDLPSRHWWNELLAPPRGLAATRTARGILETKLLCEKVWPFGGAGLSGESTRPPFYHFRLCKRDEQFSPALTWYLSKGSRTWIDDSLADNRGTCNNAQEFVEVCLALGGNEARCRTVLEEMRL